MNCYIITGTSRGLGAAMAGKLVRRGEQVVGLSRTGNPDLVAAAGENDGRFVHVMADLSEVAAIPELLRQALGYLDLDKAEVITLINNAGLLDPIGPTSKLEPSSVDRHISVNLTAPILLSGAFLRETGRLTCRRQIINITSGAASSPYPGWSSYCAGKAGLDMVTRVLAAEEEGEGRFRSIAVAPGVVETAMQERIRGSDEGAFPLKEKFVRLKEDGKLSSPDEAAAQVIAAVDDWEIASGSIVDVRRRSS